jgi:hypothetical protein
MEKAIIRDINIESDGKGRFRRVRIVFGPHYFIDIMPAKETGELTLYMGSTHHGFSARAEDVGDQLEKIINEIRKTHPELTFD